MDIVCIVGGMITFVITLVMICAGIRKRWPFLFLLLFISLVSTGIYVFNHQTYKIEEEIMKPGKYDFGMDHFINSTVPFKITKFSATPKWSFLHSYEKYTLSNIETSPTLEQR